MPTRSGWRLASQWTRVCVLCQEGPSSWVFRWARCGPAPARLVGAGMERDREINGDIHSHRLVVLADAAGLQPAPIGKATGGYADDRRPVFWGIPTKADLFHSHHDCGPASAALQLLFADSDHQPRIPYLGRHCLCIPFARACWLSWATGRQTTCTRRLRCLSGTWGRLSAGVPRS